MNSKLYVPTVTTFATLSSFLEEVVESNIRRNPALSARWFCKQLSWSSSLISEVIANRRSLSLSRTIEMAQFLGLNSVETEYLVFLSLSEEKNDDVSRHFKNEIRRRFRAIHQIEPHEAKEFIPHFSSLGVQILFAVAEADKPASLQEIQDRLYLYPEVTLDELNESIALLVQQGIAHKTSDGLKYYVDTDFHEHLDVTRVIPTHAPTLSLEYLDAAERYINSPHRQSPGTFKTHVGFMSLIDYNDTLERLDHLAKTIPTSRVGSSSDPYKPPPRTYMFCSFLIPVTRPPANDE